MSDFDFGPPSKPDERDKRFDFGRPTPHRAAAKYNQVASVGGVLVLSAALFVVSPVLSVITLAAGMGGIWAYHKTRYKRGGKREPGKPANPRWFWWAMGGITLLTRR
jgi:hypothetical protein